MSWIYDGFSLKMRKAFQTSHPALNKVGGLKFNKVKQKGCTLFTWCCVLQPDRFDKSPTVLLNSNYRTVRQVYPDFVIIQV